MGEGPTTYRVSREDMRRLDRDRNLLHLIGEKVRPGLAAFYRTLELRHFRPGTPDNDNFHLMKLPWEGLEWWMASVPIRYKTTAEAVARELGFRLADGIPTMISAGRVDLFPMKSMSAYRIENRPDAIMYAGPSAAEAANDALMERVLREERAHHQWLAAQDRIYYHGRWWHRLAEGQRAPPDARGSMPPGPNRPGHWYTTDPTKPAGWVPYPK